MRICLYIKNLQVYVHVSIKVNKMLIRLLINWSGGSCVPVKKLKNTSYQLAMAQKKGKICLWGERCSLKNTLLDEAILTL